MAEKRVDPLDGQSYSYQELLAYYKGKFKKSQIQLYWNEVCYVQAAGKKPKAKGKAKAKAKAATKAKEDGPTSSTMTKAAEDLVKVMAKRDKDWRVGCVVYQVFVDRFAPPADLQAKKELFPAPCTLHEWSENPTRGLQNKETGYWEHELQFWGGDLPSLLGKFDYLKDLSIDVLYLQPICKAFSNHKYDATDYNELEPQYGTSDDFQALVKALHAEDMKLVLDGVFNHMGKRNEAVQEALKDKESKKRDWFYFGDEYPQGFKTWGGADSLVELRLETKPLMNYIKYVVASWLGGGADGWRLDVAQELGFRHLQTITDAAHRAKKSSLVVGEVWAYPSRWMDCMDGVLNLHLGVVIYGVVSGDFAGPAAAEAVGDLVEDSCIEDVLKSWIVVSNHDMPRLGSKVEGDADRNLVQILQFTLPGCPLIYYGDEIGMVGGDDPDNRAPFTWEKVSEGNSALSHTKTCIKLRKSLRGLRIGDYRALRAGRLMAFMRTTDRVQDTVVVLVNGSSADVKETVVVPDTRILGYTLFKDELSGEEIRILGGTVNCEVKAKSARVFAMVNESENPSGAQYKRVFGHWATFKGIKP
mmetsp:Transcript_16576/g.35719  ORF Transcript_16576/g.35719 Transcript_16576/m.35719 type:complete len:586 (-) Transcript_16576:88-1845(-)